MSKAEPIILIGHLGEYQRQCDATPLPPSLLHLEIFSGDDLPGFNEKSRVRATQLTESQKALMLID